MAVTLTLAGVLAACATPPAAPAPSLPSRPATLRVDHVNPCRLLTQDQRENLGMAAGQLYENDAATGARACSFDSATGDHDDASLFIGVRAKQSASAGLPNTHPTQITINGYGALQISPPMTGSSVDCALVIDVADGQSLQVEYQAPTGDQDATCGQVRKVASMAVTNLATQAG
jgi:hypothetical protein